MDLSANDPRSGAADTLPPETREYWQGILAAVNLPPLLTEIMASGLSLDAFDPRSLAAMANRDPVLGAKLLAVANSARFGLSSPMTSIQRAIVHLGYNLVKTIMVAYQVEASFGKMAPIAKEHLNLVRRWSSCASVIAFQWGQAADLADASTAATAALLARLGTLTLALGQPKPGPAYWQLGDEFARLDFEQAGWGITTPSLSYLLIQRWGLPEPLPVMVLRQYEPLIVEYDTSYTHHSQALIAAALVLAQAYCTDPEVRAGAVFDLPVYERLKSNLAANHLLEHLGELWLSARLQRELALASEE
jgi:HD-like signal output (HDOD) protein